MGEEISLDFKALFRIIWKEKWWIILITALMTGLGIIYALRAREEFEARGRILPEVQTKGSGGLSQFAGIASLAGVDLSSMGWGKCRCCSSGPIPGCDQYHPFLPGTVQNTGVHT